jgi:drug/metabolite transporter (DMT)-like permease
MAVLWWLVGMQLTAGVVISLVPVIATVWLIRRRRLTRLQWVLVALLSAVAGVALIFGNVASCSMTTGFGGAACWWDSVPWVIRDFIRDAWSALTGQPMSRDLFPF